MKEKTLVILMGSARGGKHAMYTQEKYFIDIWCGSCIMFRRYWRDRWFQLTKQNITGILKILKTGENTEEHFSKNILKICQLVKIRTLWGDRFK